MPGWFGNSIARIRSYIWVEGAPGSVSAEISEQNTSLQTIKYPDDITAYVSQYNQIRSNQIQSGESEAKHTEEESEKALPIVVTPALELQYQLSHLNVLLDYKAVWKMSPDAIAARKHELEDIVAITDRRYYQSILSSLLLANLLLTAISTLDMTANPHRYTADFTLEIVNAGLKMTVLPLSAILSLEVTAKIANYFEANPATQHIIKKAVLWSHALAGLKFGIYDGFSAASAWSMLSKVGQRMCLGGLIEAGIQPYIQKRFFVQKNQLAVMALENLSEPALQARVAMKKNQ